MAKASAPVSRGAPQGRSLGRYLVFGEIASGGTATVHIGRRRGPAGNGQMVAIKRLHTHLAGDPQFISMFIAEARLTARVRHPNVVPLVEVLDAGGGELLLVMDYVHGETLGSLLGIARRRGRAISPGICVAIMNDMLLGLHAAHEAESEEGAPLSLVHGDVSPQNIIVGADGKARLLDFGIAKATIPISAAQAASPADGAPGTQPEATRGRRMMGTPAYMAPERWRQSSTDSDRRADLFSAGVVFWEMLALDRLFRVEGDAPNGTRPLRPVPPPSRVNTAVPPALDAVVLRALQPRPEDRWATALEFLQAITAACPPAAPEEVAAWIGGLCGERLRERAADLARIEAVASAEFVATEIADEEPTVVENDLAARLARLIERDSLPPMPRPRRATPQPAFEDAPTTCMPAREAAAVCRPQGSSPRHQPNLEETPVVTPTAIPAAGRRTPRTMPLPLAAPAPTPPAPADAGQALGAVLTSAHPVLQLTAQTQPLETTFLADPGARAAAEADESLPGRYRRAPRSFPAVSDGTDRDRPAPPRARGRLLVFVATLPSVALVLVLLGRTRPEPRAEAAPAPSVAATFRQAPVIDLERPVAVAPAAPARAEVPPAAAAPAAPPPPAPAESSVPAVAAEPVPVAAPPAPVLASARPRVAARATEARRAPPPPARAALSSASASAVGELHRRALMAYEDLDPDTALSLLQRALRLCDLGCERQPHLLALTHLHLGVVLAGGFKQPGLAAKHFRIARSLEPSLAPAARLMAPEVRAALRASAPAPASAGL